MEEIISAISVDHLKRLQELVAGNRDFTNILYLQLIEPSVRLVKHCLFACSPCIHIYTVHSLTHSPTNPTPSLHMSTTTHPPSVVCGEILLFK